VCCNYAFKIKNRRIGIDNVFFLMDKRDEIIKEKRKKLLSAPSKSVEEKT
jgi:hypothetical protein